MTGQLSCKVGVILYETFLVDEQAIVALSMKSRRNFVHPYRFYIERGRNGVLAAISEVFPDSPSSSTATRQAHLWARKTRPEKTRKICKLGGPGAQRRLLWQLPNNIKSLGGYEYYSDLACQAEQMVLNAYLHLVTPSHQQSSRLQLEARWDECGFQNSQCSAALLHSQSG